MLDEINIDGLVGPTHHFGGLGVGNRASIEHHDQPSSPRSAALEGLAKSRLLEQLGVPQFMLLPPMRPNWQLLGQLGFSGSPAEQIQAALQSVPRIVSTAFSSAFMWAANAATVTAASDSSDGRMHLTLANLISSCHRLSEAAERGPQLAQILAGTGQLELHSPLPAISPLRDEGAANHMRLCDASGVLGFNLFVYGVEECDSRSAATQLRRYIARHTLAVSQVIARRHGLDPNRTFFLRQHPNAIDAGVFHNDVIATSFGPLLLHHETAFLDAENDLQRLERIFQSTASQPLIRRVVSEVELPLSEAVKTYFFNSQIVRPTRTLDGRLDPPQLMLICPAQCRESVAAKNLIDRLLADPSCPIEDVVYVELGQSMANGGGPACLRLRAPIARDALANVKRGRLTEDFAQRLQSMIEEHYPERLTLSDFANPDFLAQIDSASRAVNRIALQFAE